MSERRTYVTKLVADFDVNDRFCLVENASFFPDEGNLRIDGEYIYYEGKTDNSFSSFTRGVRNSLRKPHKEGTHVVFTEPFNPMADALAKTTEWIGEDIYVDEHGEIFVDNKGDIKIAKGMEALDVSLRIRVRSALGKGIGTRMGVSLAGRTSDEKDVSEVIASVVDTIMAHPVVNNIENVQYTMKDDAIYITMNVYVRGLRSGFEFLYKINYHEGF